MQIAISLYVCCGQLKLGTIKIFSQLLVFSGRLVDAHEPVFVTISSDGTLVLQVLIYVMHMYKKVRTCKLSKKQNQNDLTII